VLAAGGLLWPPFGGERDTRLRRAMNTDRRRLPPMWGRELIRRNLFDSTW